MWLTDEFPMCKRVAGRGSLRTFKVEWLSKFHLEFPNCKYMLCYLKFLFTNCLGSDLLAIWEGTQCLL